MHGDDAAAAAASSLSPLYLWSLQHSLGCVDRSIDTKQLN
jgi:hypothetical protein